MSRRVSLSTEETYELAERMESMGNSKLTRRLLAISLRHFGYKILTISAILKVSERSVSTWIRTFNEGGFDALLETHYQQNRDSKLRPYQEDIRAYRLEHPEARLEDIQAWLAQEKGVEVEASWLFRYIQLHQL